MSTTPNTPAVPAIEQVLNALCAGKPRAGELLHQYVRRCCKILNGKKERNLLLKAILESLADLGLKRTDLARDAQETIAAAEGLAA